ncbi:MAG: hypothetical protein WCI27_01975 [Candidatus Omnitrophota bacterium]
MFKIAFAIFVSAFFLIKPFTMQAAGEWYTNDDVDYFAHASALSFGQFPSYNREYLSQPEQGPQVSIGAGILAAPFVFVFSGIDRLEGSSIAERRTVKNVKASWSQFGFMVSTVFYFSLACLLLYRILSSLVGPSAAVWAVILMAICQGMPLFAFRRPIFSQVPEFFLQCLCVYLFLRNEKAEGQFIRRWWAFVLLGVVAALVYLIRNNNVLFALAWPLFFVTTGLSWKDPGIMVRRLCAIFIPFTVLLMVFQLWPAVYAQKTIYSNAFDYVRVHATWLEILGRIVHVFIGVDWGLVFTAPFLLLGVLSLMFFKMPWKKRLVLFSLPVLVNFYIIVFFGTQGGWYGYRYLIASAFPVFVFPLAFAIKKLDDKGWGALKFALVLLAVMPVVSMWFFEGRSTCLSLITQFFGRKDWGHATYQLCVWKALFNVNDLAYFAYKGGAQYFHYLYYLAGSSSGFSNSTDEFSLITRVLASYTPFKLKTVVQVIIVLALPFMTVLMFQYGPALLAFCRGHKKHPRQPQETLV